MPVERWEDYVFNLEILSSSTARRKFKSAIKQEWGCCAYCGKQGDEHALTIDHVRPRSHGGSSLRSNLVPACVSCNQAKGSERDWETWFQSQSFFSPNRAARIELWIQPIPSLENGYWRMLGGTTCGTDANSRTVLSTETDINRSSRFVQGRIDHGITRLLGGKISAKADVSGQQSVSWLCLQDERRRNVVTA